MSWIFCRQVRLTRPDISCKEFHHHRRRERGGGKVAVGLACPLADKHRPWPKVYLSLRSQHTTQKKEGFYHMPPIVPCDQFFFKVIIEKCVFDVNVGTYLWWQINWMRKCGDRRKDSVMVTVWVFHDSQKFTWFMATHCFSLWSQGKPQSRVIGILTEAVPGTRRVATWPPHTPELPFSLFAAVERWGKETSTYKLKYPEALMPLISVFVFAQSEKGSILCNIHFSETFSSVFRKCGLKNTLLGIGLEKTE